MKALIIKAPYIDDILSGKKTWEMRSTRTTQRGPIALIQKGSGTVVGVVEIIDSLGPFLEDEEMLANRPYHLMTPERINDPKARKYRNAWVLKNAKRLRQPVPYKHPSGAQSWVILDEETSAAVMKAAA